MRTRDLICVSLVLSALALTLSSSLSRPLRTSPLTRHLSLEARRRLPPAFSMLGTEDQQVLEAIKLLEKSVHCECSEPRCAFPRFRPLARGKRLTRRHQSSASASVLLLNLPTALH